MQTTYKMLPVGEVEVFYREAGRADAPVVLLLHGFPTASHMFRDLIPILAGEFRVIAPDLPGFGNTVAPPRKEFDYSFDKLAAVMRGFVHALGLDRFAMYVFDYGAPVGLRLALSDPDRVAAIVTQNGNAYLDGFSDAWGLLQAYWSDPSAPNREACRELISAATIKQWQYLHGADASLVSPDGYTLDIAYLARPEADEIQLDLIYDYRNNMPLYPKFQQYFRERRPPLLATWGKNDPAFVPAGALAYRRDISDAEVHLLETGHFALETHAAVIGALMVDFLARKMR